MILGFYMKTFSHTIHCIYRALFLLIQKIMCSVKATGICVWAGTTPLLKLHANTGALRNSSASLHLFLYCPMSSLCST